MCGNVVIILLISDYATLIYLRIQTDYRYTNIDNKLDLFKQLQWYASLHLKLSLILSICLLPRTFLE